MRTLAALLFAFGAASANSESSDASDQVTDAVEQGALVRITNPQIGATFSVFRLGTLAEGYSAQQVVLPDVTVTTEEFQISTGRRATNIASYRGTPLITPRGSIFVAQEGGWYCPPAQPGVRRDLSIGIRCWADRDEDGKFEQSRLQRSSATKSLGSGNGIPYERHRDYNYLQPAATLKSVLIFEGYSNDRLRLRRIDFYDRPSRAERTERLRIRLEGSSGTIEAEGLTFEVHSVQSDRISLTRTGGSFEMAE